MYSMSEQKFLEILSRNEVAVNQVRVYMVYLEKWLLLKQMQILLFAELNTTPHYFTERIT